MIQPTTTTTENPTTPTFAIQRIYTKSSLFEAAMLTTELLKTATDATIDMQAQVNTSERENDTHEAVLTLQLTAKVTGNLVWRIQFQQAGLYTLTGFEEEGRKKILNGYCMNQLYPYAVAAISAMVVQGGFPAVYLAPMNFEALYLEQKKKEEAASETEEPVTIQ